MNIYDKLELLYQNSGCMKPEYTLKNKIYSIIEFLLIILLVIIFLIPAICFFIIYSIINILIKLFVGIYKLIRY